jgi:hypothetical protein
MNGADDDPEVDEEVVDDQQVELDDECWDVLAADDYEPLPEPGDFYTEDAA